MKKSKVESAQEQSNSDEAFALIGQIVVAIAGLALTALIVCCLIGGGQYFFAERDEIMTRLHRSENQIEWSSWIHSINASGGIITSNTIHVIN